MADRIDTAAARLRLHPDWNDSYFALLDELDRVYAAADDALAATADLVTVTRLRERLWRELLDISALENTNASTPDEWNRYRELRRLLGVEEEP